jgi:hypothetical protein
MSKLSKIPPKTIEHLCYCGAGKKWDECEKCRKHGLAFVEGRIECKTHEKGPHNW